jgi:hypothetical protein
VVAGPVFISLQDGVKGLIIAKSHTYTPLIAKKARGFILAEVIFFGFSGRSGIFQAGSQLGNDF